LEIQPKEKQEMSIPAEQTKTGPLFAPEAGSANAEDILWRGKKKFDIYSFGHISVIMRYDFVLYFRYE
jgi:hypothetical protein